MAGAPRLYPKKPEYYGEKRYHRIEIKQKGANPLIAVTGSDPEQMAKELMYYYDKYAQEFAKRGIRVGPIYFRE